MNHILLVDDDQSFRTQLSSQLSDHHHVSYVESMEEFRNSFHPYAFDLIVLDMRLENDRDGMILLREIMEADPYQLVIVVTKYVDTETHIAAIENGAQLYLNKNEFPVHFIGQMVDVILQQGHLRRRIENLEKRLAAVDSSNMIIASPEMQDIQGRIAQVAEDGEVTVLIRGESGTGKELVAHNIHRLSPRRQNGPFIAVSVAGLNKTTINSELFGHERGAFTGAIGQHKGYLEEAHGGTLFLDEIGDLDMETQVKLLRMLETRTFQRLGSTQEITSDFQLITATNRDLSTMIDNGEFRKDLYYRLQAFEIRIPPLRERRKDIAPLAEYFLDNMVKEGRTTATAFHPIVMERLLRYDWPGNVRELRNVIEYSAIQARAKQDALIQLAHLPVSFQEDTSTKTNHASLGIMDYQRWLARAEIELCAKALDDAGKIKKSELAQQLGYNDRFIFLRRIRKALKLCPEAKEEFPQVAKIFS